MRFRRCWTSQGSKHTLSTAQGSSSWIRGLSQGPAKASPTLVKSATVAFSIPTDSALSVARLPSYCFLLTVSSIVFKLLSIFKERKKWFLFFFLLKKRKNCFLFKLALGNGLTLIRVFNSFGIWTLSFYGCLCTIQFNWSF